jgi:hypothetical protein
LARSLSASVKLWEGVAELEFLRTLERPGTASEAGCEWDWESDSEVSVEIILEEEGGSASDRASGLWWRMTEVETLGPELDRWAWYWEEAQEAVWSEVEGGSDEGEAAKEDELNKVVSFCWSWAWADDKVDVEAEEEVESSREGWGFKGSAAWGWSERAKWEGQKRVENKPDCSKSGSVWVWKESEVKVKASAKVVFLRGEGEGNGKGIEAGDRVMVL